MKQTLLQKLELDDSPPQEQEPESLQETSFNSQEVQDLSKNSLDFLAALAMPVVFKYLFPPVFKAIWDWLLSYVHRARDFSQLAIGLPRGFGKTMLIKIFVLYCVLFTKKSFILIICGTQTKANNILADIQSMLDESLRRLAPRAHSRSAGHQRIRFPGQEDPPHGGGRSV